MKSGRPSQIQKLISGLALLFGRFRLWVATVLVLTCCSPLDNLDHDVRVRMLYACMMSYRDPRTRNLVARWIRRERGSSVQTDLWLGRICWTLGELRLSALLYRGCESAPCTRSEKELCVSLRRLAEAIVDRSISTTISALIDALALPDPGNGPLIVAPVSSGYADLFEVWERQARRHFDGHPLLLALDNRAGSMLPKNPDGNFDGSLLDLSRYFAYDDAGKMEAFSRSSIWMLRVLVLGELAARGYSIVSLDLDAMVVGDLAAMLALLPAADMVAQIDYSIPMDVARKHGFVICCGFMAIRPGAAANAFFSRYCAKVMLEMDDQFALNHLLAEDGLRDVVTTASHKTFSSLGLTWVCPDRSLVSRDLHSGSVIRHFSPTGKNIDEIKQGLGVG